MIIIRKAKNFVTGVLNRLRTRLFRETVASCGNVSVFGRIAVINPRNIRIGNNCNINHGCYLNAFNPILIGNDVTLSANVSIISTGLDVNRWISGERSHIINDGISIGDHVWIGAGAQILSNVKIKGPFVVVAAGSVVTRDIEDSYCIVGGCPAKIIKSLK